MDDVDEVDEPDGDELLVFIRAAVKMPESDLSFLWDGLPVFEELAELDLFTFFKEFSDDLATVVIGTGEVERQDEAIKSTELSDDFSF